MYRLCLICYGRKLYVEELIRGFDDVGADEVVCWPTVAELEQVDRLAEVAG